jgi:molybdopterin/thiamine biosynthesis adenylyltransferase
MATRTNSLFSREQLAGYDPGALAGATVLVVGAGALAQNLLLNLSLSGIGNLRVVDFDRFEPHNAPRSPMFPDAGEQALWGMEKARVVAHKSLALCRANDPTVLYAVEPVQALGAGAFEGVDVVAACVDNPEARAYLSDTCSWLGISLIEGGFDGSEVTLSSFPAVSAAAAATEPCYRCGNSALAGSFSCQRRAVAALEAGITPAIQAAAATLGGLQAEAVIQALQGNFPMGRRRTSIDIRDGKYSQYELVVDPDCQGIHRRVGTVTEIEIEASDSVRALLDSVEADLGKGATIELPDRLIWNAFCDNCGTPVEAEAPDWAWRASPFCIACGGEFPRLSAVPNDFTPTIVSSVDHGLRGPLAQCSCVTLGIRSRDVLEAEAGGRVKQYRLAGDLSELFVRATTI